MPTISRPPCCSRPTSAILLAPAMNPRMWAQQGDAAQSQAARRRRRADGRPERGEMAESGEAGLGRMAEPLEIVAAIEKLSTARRDDTRQAARRQAHRRSPPARRTSRSIRCATSRTAPPASRATPSRARRPQLGASVTLVSGPVTLPDPPGVKTVRVESARDMLQRSRGGAAGGCRHLRRRGRRLAHRGRGRAETEEGRQRPAAARARGESRHPGDGLETQVETADSSSSASRPRPRR